jgi:hypothetical protein
MNRQENATVTPETNTTVFPNLIQYSPKGLLSFAVGSIPYTTFFNPCCTRKTST